LQVVSLSQRTSFTGPDESLIYPPLFSKDGRVANYLKENVPFGEINEELVKPSSPRLFVGAVNV
jgi:hypothetical protein